jgi:hypothetical protein
MKYLFLALAQSEMPFISEALKSYRLLLPMNVSFWQRKINRMLIVVT